MLASWAIFESQKPRSTSSSAGSSSFSVLYSSCQARATKYLQCGHDAAILSDDCTTCVSAVEVLVRRASYSLVIRSSMSSTCEIQLEAPIVYPSPQAPPTSSSKFHAGILDGNDRQAKSLAVVHPQQQWNRPRINMWRVFATFVSFILMGANDAAYGVWPPPTRMKSHADQFQALIPYV